MKLLHNEKENICINIYLVCILFLFIFFLSPKVILDTDFMWHLKVGEYIYNNKTVPLTNVFGYLNNLKFFAHEWFYDLILYISHLINENYGILTFTLILASYIVLSINNFIYKKTNNYIFSFLMSLYLISSMNGFIVARPQILSYSIFICLTKILINNFENLKKYIIHLILLVILLVNSHAGSYPAFFAIFGLYICSEFIEKMLEYDKDIVIDINSCSFSNYFKFLYLKYIKKALNHTKVPLIILVCLIPFLIINPYGADIYLYPFKVTSNSDLLNYISEWQPTEFIGESLIILVFSIISLISIYISKSKTKFRDILFISVFLVMSTHHIRHLSLLILYSIMLSSPYIYESIVSILKKIVNILSLPPLSIDIYRKRYYLIFNLIVLLFLIYTAEISISNYGKLYNDFRESLYPVKIVDYLKDGNLDLKNNILLNDYNYGGYLMQNNIPVYIDGRADVYVKSVNGVRDVFFEYIDLCNGKSDWKKYLNDNNIKYILLDKNKVLSKIIQNSNEFKILLEDDVAILAEYIKK